MPKNSQFVPPALPPKKQKTTSASNASLNIIVTPPVSPKILNDNAFAQNAVDEKLEIKLSPSNQSNDDPRISISVTPETETVVLRKKQTEIVIDIDFILSLVLNFNSLQIKPLNLMEELNVNDYLVFKKDGEEGPLTLVGGRSEALIIHATRVQKVSEGKFNLFNLHN